MIELDRIRAAAGAWKDATPFPHVVVDGFFADDAARALENEFPDFGSDTWHVYGNAIENKKACNNWNLFPPLTYRAFQELNSPSFVDFLATTLLGSTRLYADNGLNGGGWHIHGRGGKLNMHLDYSIHPKLDLQRKLNIIVYLNSSWDPAWGGQLGLWGNESAERPGALATTIDPSFNRAVIFDTTCNSWHGLPTPLACPDDQFRKSLAVYYLAEPAADAPQRGKALFAPTEDQAGDPEVLDLIRRRSQVATAHEVYKKD